MPDHAVLPHMRLALTLDDIYRVYAAGVADGSGETHDAPTPSLASLLTTLRGRYFDDHAEDLLHALDDAPAWLKAQTTLKERAI